MTQSYQDSIGNTQAFRAFAQTSEPVAPARSTRLPLLAGAIVAALAVVAVLGWLAVG